MIRQGNRKIVAVEGFELPTWFLNDPERSKRWTIITSIRDPVDRLVSISRLKCPNDPNRCWSRSTDVATGFPLNNVMVRMFAGGSATTKNMRLSNYKITEKDLSTAIHVLESQYQFIIITEWLPKRRGRVAAMQRRSCRWVVVKRRYSITSIRQVQRYSSKQIMV